MNDYEMLSIVIGIIGLVIAAMAISNNKEVKTKPPSIDTGWRPATQ